MGTNKWRGDAPAVAQVNTVTPASVVIGNTFTLTINAKAITFTATATTVANVTAGLVAAVQASTIKEFQEVIAADITTALTLTSRVAGRPFTQTSSAATGAGSGTPTLSTSTTTASSGPNDYSVAANWTLGAVPVNSDDVIIDGAVDVSYGLAQSGVLLTTLTIPSTYTGKIGLPDRNPNGYYEYRSTFLATGATTISVGYGGGSGSGRIRLDPGAHATTINVGGTGNPTDAASANVALEIKGSGSNYTLNVSRGFVGVAVAAGSSATLPTVRGGSDGFGNGATLTLGSGCTITTVLWEAGQVHLYAGLATLDLRGGEAWTYGSAAVSSVVRIDEGAFHCQSNGTIAFLIVASKAVADFTQDLRSRTVTAATVYAGATINDPGATVTWSGGILLEHCKTDEVDLDLGDSRTLTVA